LCSFVYLSRFFVVSSMLIFYSYWKFFLLIFKHQQEQSMLTFEGQKFQGQKSIIEKLLVSFIFIVRTLEKIISLSNRVFLESALSACKTSNYIVRCTTNSRQWYSCFCLWTASGRKRHPIIMKLLFVIPDQFFCCVWAGWWFSRTNAICANFSTLSDSRIEQLFCPQRFVPP
jgi:hypothetical protein